MLAYFLGEKGREGELCVRSLLSRLKSRGRSFLTSEIKGKELLYKLLYLVLNKIDTKVQLLVHKCIFSILFLYTIVACSIPVFRRLGEMSELLRQGQKKR